jgi:mono/diheme cytochrome c family protein
VVKELLNYGNAGELEKFKMKKQIIQSCGWVLGILLLNFGCQSKPPLATEQAGYPKEKVDAHALFNESCAKCHGKDGRAKTFHGKFVGAQNLTDAKWQADTSDEEIIHAIKTGPKAMPAFEKKLSQSEIDALAAYVRSFKQAQ